VADTLVRTPTRNRRFAVFALALVLIAPYPVYAQNAGRPLGLRVAARPTPLTDSIRLFAVKYSGGATQTRQVARRSRCPVVLTVATVLGPVVGGAIGAAVGSDNGKERAAIAGALIALGVGLAICLR
jgi:hypothetical protein